LSGEPQGDELPVQYCRATRIVWRLGHDTVLVLPLSGDHVHVISGAAEGLWQLLVEPLTVHQAASSLAEIYDVSSDEILQEIAPLLDDLVGRGVLERMGSA
jgi:Coenzyme PQQ synthesis protein D (PqqD)